jgi:hypothetical protein
MESEVESVLGERRIISRIKRIKRICGWANA